MSTLTWQQGLPDFADLQGRPQAHYWVRGWNFNRPVIVLVNAGVRQAKAKTTTDNRPTAADTASEQGSPAATGSPRRFQAELNFCFFADGLSNQTLWREDLVRMPIALEWCGPLQDPPA